MITEGTTYKRNVTIYEQENYQGRRRKLGPGKYNIVDLAFKNHRFSSLIVPDGMKVTLFKHADFSGSEK